MGYAVEGAQKAGAVVEVLDLKKFPLPLYDADLEQQEGLPKNVLFLKDWFLKCDALLIACPEYNSSITPLLKNTLDWVSRPRSGEGQLACFQGKTAALVSASPGSLGGLRGVYQLREILSNMGVLVLPHPVAVPKANEYFADPPKLENQKIVQSLIALGENLVKKSELLLQ